MEKDTIDYSHMTFIVLFMNMHPAINSYKINMLRMHEIINEHYRLFRGKDYETIVPQFSEMECMESYLQWITV